MARNRKRAKERRARQPQPVVGATNGAPEDEAPNPIAHAAPDVELAEAQLALGRPDLADAQPAAESGVDDVDDLDDEEFEELEDEVDAAAAGGGKGGPPATDEDELDGGGGGLEGPRLEPDAHAPAPRTNPGSRLLHFLQGSWRELQRVQWPDRRQVIQATGVVIGFVIVAGVFLGVADFLSGHLMNYILEGHW